MKIDFRAIVETAPELVQCVSTDGRLLYANAAWREELGYTVDEVHRLTMNDFICESSMPHCQTVLQKLLSGAPVSPAHAEFRRKDRTHLWVEGKLSCTFQDGRPLYTMGHFTRLSSQAQLSRLQERFFSVSLDLLCVADFDGYFRLLNPAWEKILGYSRDELQDRPFLEFVHPDDQEVTQQEAAGLAKGSPTAFFQNRYRHKNGSYRWVRWVAASDVETRSILACAHDITDELQQKNLLSQARAEAEEASVAKSSFLANMSHELRTPLNSVIGFSELLCDEAFGPLNSKQSRYVENVLSNGRHLLGLINDILDLSKVEAGEMDFEVQLIDLKALAMSVLEKMRPLSAKKSQSLTLQADNKTYPALGDDDRTRQVLLNLVSNAIKFTPNDGEIGIRLESGIDQCQVTVWDTGRGLSTNDLPSVFERFKQVDSGLTREASGTGLGLALCHHFVEEQRGKIWAESSGPDQGSQFHFTLRTPDQAAYESEEAPVGREDGPLVLVVEDDLCSSELLITHLASAGYRTIRAFSGERALKLATEFRPGAITLDLQLPDITGWEVLRRLKASSDTEAIPVIVSSIVDSRAHGFSVEASDFLPKPVDKKSLLETMSKWLPPGEQKRILLIDDDPQLREMISSWLESHGLMVHEARGGKEGIEMLNEVQPDAVIVDLNMPGMNGFETVERIRADYSSSIPVVVFTSAKLSQEDRVRLSSQTDGVVSKSEKSNLLSVLKSVLNKETEHG